MKAKPKTTQNALDGEGEQFSVGKMSAAGIFCPK